MMTRKTLFTMVLWLFGLSTFAQTLTVTKEFTLVPNSSVLAMYKNQFGKWEKADLDDTFPYAVIRVALDGEAKDVSMAKKKLGLYLGTQRMVVDVYTDNVNEILFLIPSGAGHVQLQCGDGCTPYTIIDLPRLRSNMVYSGRVHFVPAEGSEVVEVVDVEKLKQELFAEFLSMQQQQLQQQQKTSVTPDSVEEKIHMEPKEKDPVQSSVSINTFLLAEVGLAKNPEWGVGLMFGQKYNGIGWYVKGRSNFTFPKAGGHVISDYAIPSYRDTSSEWVIDAGLVFDFLGKITNKPKNTNLGIYVGAGYGARTRYLETVDYGWQKYMPNSYSGVSVDAGVIGSIYGFTLSVGVNTIGFKYMEIEMGVGYTF